MKHAKVLVLMTALLALCSGASFAADTAAVPAVAAPTQAKVTLTAAGSGVNLGITKLLADAFMAKNPTIEIKVPGSIGTKGAITAVKDNAIAFGLISRPLKESELSADYTNMAYAKTALVVAANQSVKDTALTEAELTAIYKGEKIKWQDGSEIVVQIREAFDSGFMVLEEVIPGFKDVCDEARKAARWAVYFTDQDANRALSSTPSAIGVTDLGMIATEKLSVKPLAFGGVMPSVETLQSGQYKLSRTLYALYRPKDLSPEARAFLDFLKTEEAAALMKANGYIPQGQ